MKDEKDPSTKDAFPKKKGRPCLKETGPMTSSERQRRRRSKGVVKEFVLLPSAVARLEEIARRNRLDINTQINALIHEAKLPRKD